MGQFSPNIRQAKSLRRHQALEFFKPVEDDDQLCLCWCFSSLLGSLDYQEALAEYTHGFRCS